MPHENFAQTLLIATNVTAFLYGIITVQKSQPTVEVFYCRRNYAITSNWTASDCSNDTVLDLDQIFGNIFNQSKQQAHFSRSSLLKAMRFVMEQRDQYDPELVAFVRSQIIDPPKVIGRPKLYTKNVTDFSQLGQSTYIDNLMHSKRNGFYVEAGAFDGELYSNGLFFELERNWTGLLIEPTPTLFRAIEYKKRNAFLLNACLAGRNVKIIRFEDLALFSKQHSSMEIEDHNQVYMNIPCFSPNTVLRAIGVNNVDYFSLDVEGGELEVIEDIDFSKFTIQSLTIEYNGKLAQYTKMLQIMLSKGYNETKNDGQDFYLRRTRKENRGKF